MIKYAYFFLSHPKAKTVKFVPLCYSKTGMVFLEAMNIVFILAIESRKVHPKATARYYLGETGKTRSPGFNL